MTSNARDCQLQRLEPHGVHALFNNAGTNYSEDFETYPVQAGANDHVDIYIDGISLDDAADHDQVYGSGDDDGKEIQGHESRPLK